MLSMVETKDRGEGWGTAEEIKTLPDPVYLQSPKRIQARGARNWRPGPDYG